MNERANELEGRLESLTQWPAEHEPTLWKPALDRADEPRTLRLPPRYMLGIAAMVMLAAVGVWASMGLLGRANSRPTVMMGPGLASVPESPVAGEPLQPVASLDARPRAIQRSATMELTTEAVRPLFDRVTGIIDPSLGEFIENASASEVRADATLRVSAQRLDAAMRSIREMDGVIEVVREELSAVDATDRRADLDARLANERRIEVELLELIDTRPEAPLADVLRVREALGEVRLSIEHIEAQRATLNERVALATLRVSVVALDDGDEPEAGLLHELGDAMARGARTLAGSAAWIVEVFVGGLIVWVILAALGVWAYRALRWRATWA